MNRRIIKSLLKNKINAWLKSIEDEKVRAAAKKDAIVTGGCIASMLLGEEIKDFDIYFKTRETCRLVTNYYVDQFNVKKGSKRAIVVCTENLEEIKKECQLLSEDSEAQTESEFLKRVINKLGDRIRIYIDSSGVAAADNEKTVLDTPFEDVFDVLPEDKKGEEKPKYRPVFLSSNAITLSDQIQLVIRFFGDVETIHENYDFVHCTNSWEASNSHLDLKPAALEALLNRELIYQGSKYPVCSVIRTRKFIKRGFHINAGQYLKMCFQISQMDLTDIDTLEDQLVGVDSAYFMALIDALRAKSKSDEGFKVNATYLGVLIDKIF